ncbi:hypothetical protein LIER_37641 [Lithospermum erythrorhizon]|uniref:Uncharacterized protein n=1 Tax=Lithospermum erythrorhizon TaxID=34254 RepID=A0AAV3PNE0_LITER
MAKNQTNKKSNMGIYGKLKDTVLITPFRKSQPHTIDNNNHVTYYGSSSSNPFISNSTPQKTEKTHAAKPYVSYNKKLMKMLTGTNKSASKVDKKVDNDQDYYNNDDNDEFSEYINRVKGGMRSESNVGTETVPPRRVARRDSLNDKVSNFLGRARMKNRTTSSVGDMRAF